MPSEIQQAVACIHPPACVAAPHTPPVDSTDFKPNVQGVCGMYARVLCRSNHCFKLSATVGRILVSDKIFNAPVVAIHCRNAQNVGFENPTYKIIPSIIL